MLFMLPLHLKGKQKLPLLNLKLAADSFITLAVDFHEPIPPNVSILHATSFILKYQT